jgi:Cu(I)/Ag(I) efflux system membrane fusion protein
MFLTGEIVVRQSKNSAKNQVLIPNSAILWTGNKSVVYVQLTEEDVPTYQFREVKIGSRKGDFTTIDSGVENGEEVVVNGAFAIDAAAQLSNNQSMMNRFVSTKKGAHEMDVVPDFLEETPEEFLGQLDLVLMEYITLKNAFVSTDSINAAEKASSMLTKLSKIDPYLVKGEARKYWKEQANAIESHGKKINSLKEVEKQRNQFDFLSQAMINTVRAFGTKDKTYFVLHCPMANDNQGADWISAESEIRNPYFGDKMLKCGIVKLELE